MIRRVLFCGAWDEGDGYPRATALRAGLQQAGIEVTECRSVGTGRGKQRLLRAPWRWPWFACTLLWRRWSLCRALRAALRRHRPEVVVVPYPGHHVVGDVARIADVPVVLDLFLSAHDTVIGDRRLFAEGSLPAKALRALDRAACRAADLVLLDTDANVAHVAALVAMPTAHFASVPIGDPAAPPTTAPYTPPTAGHLRVLFFGTGVPLHGLDVLIDAVAMVPAVTLVLVGGTHADRACAQARLGPRLDLQPEFVDRGRLQAWIDGADLVAGVFSGGDKARRVVPFKVVHALASGRPVITADVPAVRAVLRDGEGAFLVPPGDASALAARLRELAAAPSALVAAAAAARPVYDREFAVARSGQRLCALLDGLVTAHGGSR